MKLKLLKLGMLLVLLIPALGVGQCNKNCDQIAAAAKMAGQSEEGVAVILKAAGCPVPSPTTPPTPPPPPTCTATQHLEGGVCVDNVVPPPEACPAGQHFENGVCVTDTTPPPPPPPPPPPSAACPAKLPDVSAQTINTRCMSAKCRTDATGRVGDRGNDEGYCGIVTGNPAIHSCKVNPEGAGLAGCDAQFWQGPCAYWFFSVDGGRTWDRCLPDGIDAQGNPRSGGGAISCDHFDDWNESQGEYTGVCDRSNFGLRAPISGYHMVPHGRGLVRACKADQSVCSDPPLDVNF